MSSSGMEVDLTLCTLDTLDFSLQERWSQAKLYETSSYNDYAQFCSIFSVIELAPSPVPRPEVNQSASCGRVEASV